MQILDKLHIHFRIKYIIAHKLCKILKGKSKFAILKKTHTYKIA